MWLLCSFIDLSKQRRHTERILVGLRPDYLTGRPVEALFNSSLCLQKMAVKRSQASQSIPLAERGVGAEHGGSWASGVHHLEDFTSTVKQNLKLFKTPDNCLAESPQWIIVRLFSSPSSAAAAAPAANMTAATPAADGQPGEALAVTA